MMPEKGKLANKLRIYNNKSYQKMFRIKVILNKNLKY